MSEDGLAILVTELILFATFTFAYVSTEQVHLQSFLRVKYEAFYSAYKNIT